MKNSTLQKTDALRKHLNNLSTILAQCTLCPRQCNTNRERAPKGYCNASKDMVVYTAFLHRGEEPVISGEKGSGTIFFSGCGLRCVYCQNYTFSHTLKGKKITPRKLSRIMLTLQERGAHNINLVSPTHFLPHIANALKQALHKGLTVPLVYNTSGYETLAIIVLLNDIVDVYLADMKYVRSKTAKRYSHAPDYPLINQKALLAMYKSKRKAIIVDGIMKKGLIVRHLVLPGHLDESREALLWLKKNLPEAFISVMTQYQPYYQASQYAPINRPLNVYEYNEISKMVEQIGITNGWVQEFEPQENLAGIHFKPSLIL